MTDPAAPVPVAVHRLLRQRGATVAVAESLTGGLLAAALTDPPGASSVFRGGVIAYATDLKQLLLGVPPSWLADPGPVSARVAEAMARGVRHRLAADHGLAVTGVAGPDPQAGRPPGTVFAAVADQGGVTVRELRLSGDRRRIRELAVHGALDLLHRRLRAGADPR